MTEAIIIGDIAGQYDALMRLLKKCPDYLPISVGDMIDRGPDSKKVLDFFMAKGKAVLGNHEHMMLDLAQCKYYEIDVWVNYNGGVHTVRNFIPDTASMSYRQMREGIPAEYMDWLGGLPLYMEIDNALITHAPLHPQYSLEEACALTKCSFQSVDYAEAEASIIWNREPPKRLWDKYQIFGHNRYHCFYTDDEDPKNFEYGVCLDNSGSDQLVAMVWPSRETLVESFC